MVKKVLTLLLVGVLALTGCSSQPTAPAPTPTPQESEKSWEPEENVEFVIPFSAGGGSDVFARKIVEIIQKNNMAPVSFIPTNKPGGSGVVGYTYMNSKGANNYIMGTTSSSFYSQPILGLSPLSLDKDFTYIAHLAKDPNLFAASKKVGLNTLEEVIEYAKANPKKLKFGGTANASDDTVLMYMINDLIGIELVYVPYDSGSEVLAAILGGHIDLCAISPSEGGEHLQTGNLVPLAVSADERISLLPDVPTFLESGYEIKHQQSRGVVMNAGVPEEVAKYYSDLFKKVTETPEWKEFLESNVMGDQFMGYDEYEKFSNELSGKYKTYMELIQKAQ
ncbi:MAG: hypothetical protein K0R09_3391 [Clostridiales bacterium]|jgi:putative tricarboxylic transport membrane protein|nr:hypothetical protein [Clostridiales bacterium]MDF2803469.1 hypothetical protein [Anaerocolumna sp.]